MTLIEVLVAVVILSVGLLGLAGLQTMGLKNINTAGTHAHVAILANNLVERIRINSSNITSYMAAISCPSSATIAEMDYCEVFARATGDLNGDGDVLDAGEIRLLRTYPGTQLFTVTDCGTCTGAGMYTLTVRWAEQDLTGTDQLRTYGFNFKP